VRANIDQNFTRKIRKGEAASVILRGREDQPLLGHVLRIDPQADAGTEEMVAEVAFNIPLDEFLLNQWANVYIQVGEAKDALVVPRTALMPTEDETYVFVVDANDKIRQEPVTVLASSPRTPMVAVAGHLRPGERVVLMPTGLRAGETVRPAAGQKAQASRPAP
jgi:multidrug efflux pump subunit AcrA (membrane-fusion protein)